MLSFVLVLLMASTFSVVFYGLFYRIFQNKIEMEKRIESLISASMPEKETHDEPKTRKKKNSQLFNFLKEKLRRLLAKKLSKQKEDMLKTLLTEAGNPFNLTPIDFKMYQLLLGIFFTLFILIVFLPQTDKTLQALIISGIAGMFGHMYPLVYLKSKKKQRMLQIQKMMPDFFDMVNVSIEAGLGLDGALNKVAKQMKGPLPEEFLKTLEDIRLGTSKKEAFHLLANRVPSEQFKSVINALIQADQMGIGMSKVLRAQTTRIREQRRQEVKEQAMKAPIKMMFPMILFIFPTLFIVLMGPIIVKLVTEWM